LTIFKFSDINNKIIPFFEQNPLLGVKLFDYLDWCKVAKLMNNGSHLTHTYHFPLCTFAPIPLSPKGDKVKAVSGCVSDSPTHL